MKKATLLWKIRFAKSFFAVPLLRAIKTQIVFSFIPRKCIKAIFIFNLNNKEVEGFHLSHQERWKIVNDSEK